RLDHGAHAILERGEDACPRGLELLDRLLRALAKVDLEPARIAQQVGHGFATAARGERACVAPQACHQPLALGLPSFHRLPHVLQGQASLGLSHEPILLATWYSYRLVMERATTHRVIRQARSRGTAPRGLPAGGKQEQYQSVVRWLRSARRGSGSGRRP